jgi:hypothetical protein
MSWFLELAESYFGDEDVAKQFVCDEMYSPEMLYLLDKGLLDSTLLEQVKMEYWSVGDPEDDYWYQRDADIHWRVTITSDLEEF